jgi:hypothetical protein
VWRQFTDAPEKYTKLPHNMYTKWSQNVFNGRKIDLMFIKNTKIFRNKTLQNLPKFGIFCLKTNHLATLTPHGIKTNPTHAKNFIWRQDLQINPSNRLLPTK